MRTASRGPLSPIFDGTRMRGGQSVGNLAESPVSCFDFEVTGLYATFDGGCSTAPGAVVSYGWAFGDGDNQTLTGPTTSHNYSSPGTYSVFLVVTDNNGNTALSSQDVTV